MKIAAITFHGAHNYGSMLQAYALQTYIKKLCAEQDIACEYKILNFRTKLQKRFYSAPKANSLKGFVKSMMYLPYKEQLDKQYEKFEQFLSEHLNVTEEFSDLESLNNAAKNFDCLIAGSDQIWNVRAKDFSFAYLFEGLNEHKISYAASLGPLDIDWKMYDKERYTALLKQFENISVREQHSKNILDNILENDKSLIHIDPTLLLSANDWRNVQSDMNIKNGKYILFYCLEPNKNHIRIAKLLSKKYNLPVVATKYRNKHDYFNNFIKQYDAGPKDFLSLIDNASLIVTSSFHGTAFSMIYGKPFYVIDGLKDGRINTLLKLTHTEQNNISQNITDIESAPVTANADEALKSEREKSRNYLMNAILK